MKDLNYKQGEIVYDEDESHDRYVEDTVAREREALIRHFEEQDEEVQDEGRR